MNDLSNLVCTAGAVIHLSLKGRSSFLNLDAGTFPKNLLLQKVK